MKTVNKGYGKTKTKQEYKKLKSLGPSLQRRIILYSQWYNGQREGAREQGRKEEWGEEVGKAEERGDEGEKEVKGEKERVREKEKGEKRLGEHKSREQLNETLWEKFKKKQIEEGKGRVGNWP